ncbi:aspartate aminotransferase family protein [Agitococcus lubricus]|uniref:Acetylornithine aminotransferase n=1 Tax=Agitococcus lubricus TaxID=1077255 RepID=A0A2T5IWL5_9GAMM|nr:aspartate aminotransferase family protein [Agitococcus lubricus]PTQ88303.1 acetylornithine aminotransferase [Agitococcus lubricus]
MTSALMPTYARQPIAFVKGQGCWLYDADGQAYLDALTGIAVCGLGHAHPVVAKAIAEQAETLVHTSNLYQVPLQEALGQALRRVSGMEFCFFSNSGAEANEAAIKLARVFGHQKNIAEPTIIVMENSFHGRTMATLSATGNKKVQIGFEPLVQGFVRVPFDDISAIEQAIAENPNIVAILVEPIQGEGGIRVSKQGFAYLEALRRICDQHDLLLMLDEIQTGNGRTGKYFAYQHTQIKPDVVTTAKGLGNGFPIGACLVQGKARDLFKPGNHGSTYGGTPLACRAALTVVELLEQGPIDNAATVGQYLIASFRDKLADLDVQVNGHGMMIGIRLPRPCAELVGLARDEEKLLLNVTADSVIRLLPTLTLTQSEADEIILRVCRLVRRYLA